MAGTTVQQVIDDAIQTSTEMQGKATAYSDNAINLANTLVVPYALDDIEEPNRPDLDPPSVDLADLLDSLDNARQLEIENFIDDRVDEFLSDYFPNFKTDYNAVQAKIADWIENGGTGINPTVLNQIWDVQRNREDKLALEELDSVADNLARRGWSIPPGILTSRQQRATQAVINRKADLGRTITIDEATREQQNIQFAINRSVDIHQGALNAAVNFINVLLRSYVMGDAKANDIIRAHTMAWEQAVQYHAQKINAEQMMLRWGIVDHQADANQLNLTVETLKERVRNSTSAAMSSAKVVGEIGSSAIASTNTMASLAAEE